MENEFGRIKYAHLILSQVGVVTNAILFSSLTCDGACVTLSSPPPPKGLLTRSSRGCRYITPRNVGDITKYPAGLGANQVCTLVGSSPGSAVVSGSDYISANFDYDSGGESFFQRLLSLF